MKIIELNSEQFRNYSKIHSLRNYKQTVEYANMMKDYTPIYLGYINEESNTILGAVLILERNVYNFKVGYVPGCFLIDYTNDNLFKDFIKELKLYLKNKKFIYLNTDNITTYKMYNKNNEVIYFDTNILKSMNELSFKKINTELTKKIVLETEKTPDETYKLFNNNTKRNINLSLKKAITIYKDEENNIETLLNLNGKYDKEKIINIINNFNTPDNMAEIYFAKLEPEKYINNYRYYLKKEEENNYKLNKNIQDPNISNKNIVITKKMESDKLINKYNNEINKATKLYTKYNNEVILGAILIIKNNREIYFLNEGYDKNLLKFYSSHLIKWEIIKKYLQEGYKIFNFGYVEKADKTNSDYLFKMGFGGNVYETIGKYDLIINKWLYKIVKILDKNK